MKEIHTDTADIKLISNSYWNIVFKENVIVTLIDMLKIYRLIGTLDLHSPLLLDIRNIGGIEFEALEFTASEDDLTNRIQLIVYTHNSISEKYVSLIENLDLGRHDYHIFNKIHSAIKWLQQN